MKFKINTYKKSVREQGGKQSQVQMVKFLLIWFVKKWDLGVQNFTVMKRITLFLWNQLILGRRISKPVKTLNVYQTLLYLEQFATVQNQLTNVQKEISVSMEVLVSRVYLIFFFTVKVAIHKVKANGLILRKSNK